MKFIEIAYAIGEAANTDYIPTTYNEGAPENMAAVVGAIVFVVIALVLYSHNKNKK